MDLVRFGRGIRALRLRRRWRQADLAAAARVSASTVARIERGGGDRVAPAKLDRVANAIGGRIDLRLTWNGEGLDRLLDQDHAALAELAADALRSARWEVVLEATFWIRGERGSIDILAWHAGARVVLVIEVKSVVPDVQATLAVFDRRVRLAAEIARDRGWAPVAIGKLLVIGDGRTARRRIDRHAATFQASFPQRTVEAKRWIKAPDAAAPLRALWFLPNPHGTTIRRAPRRS